MRYNFRLELDVKRAKTYLAALIEKESYVEIKKITKYKKLRSLKQNNYLHLLLAFFALEYGETLSYVKLEIFKKIVNPKLFKSEYKNKVTGKVREDWRSTADLSTIEMTQAIDRFRNYSSKEAGIYLPSADEKMYLIEIDKQISRHSLYL